MQTWHAVIIAGALIAAAVALRSAPPTALAQDTRSLPGPQSPVLQSQQIDDLGLAQCILRHHAVGSDRMASYVIGACRAVLKAESR